MILLSRQQINILMKCQSLNEKVRSVFTSKETAVFMAGLFGVPENKTRLQILDAGAGSGVLSIALIERLQEIPKLQYVHLVCYENDSKIIELLRKNLQWVRQHTTLSLITRFGKITIS